MQITKQRAHQSETCYCHEFSFCDGTGAGYSFPCDRHGALLPDVCGDRKRNFILCLGGEIDGIEILDLGVRSWELHYTEPAEGRCECGELVVLANFTNTCVCGKDYNSAGQELAPREQWGEETGEHWSECY